MIMRQIYNRTLEIRKLVENYDSKRREGWLADLRKLLNERGRLVTQLSGPCSDEDRTLGRQVTAMNREINESLQKIKQDIIGDMKAFKHRKRSVNRYRHPYTGPTRDGMFLDKKG
ncbi:MAG: flagellar protein FliT [Sporolactobacillus sp.]|jgi:flagellar protein FliT|nr:flagellar protein FliT [Sporolactobacillus sp.]